MNIKSDYDIINEAYDKFKAAGMSESEYNLTHQNEVKLDNLTKQAADLLNEIEETCNFAKAKGTTYFYIDSIESIENAIQAFKTMYNDDINNLEY